VGASLSYLKLRARDYVELRNVFDPAAVGHGAAQRHMQLHQEVRAHWKIERFDHVRYLEPWRDPADARNVDLHDRASAGAHVILELARAIERFADRDRHRSVARKLDVRREIVGGQRLLEPGHVERFEMT